MKSYSPCYIRKKKQCEVAKLYWLVIKIFLQIVSKVNNIKILPSVEVDKRLYK